MTNPELLLLLSAIKKTAQLQTDDSKVREDIVELLDSVIVELKRQTPTKKTSK